MKHLLMLLVGFAFMVPLEFYEHNNKTKAYNAHPGIIKEKRPAELIVKNFGRENRYLLKCKPPLTLFIDQYQDKVHYWCGLEINK